MMVGIGLILLIIIIEYLGVGYYYLPIVNAISFTLITSFSLFLYLTFTNDLKTILQYRATQLLLFIIILTTGAMLHGLVKSNAIEPLKQLIGYYFLFVCIFYLTQDINRFRLFIIGLFASNVVISVINKGKYFGERAGDFKAGYFLMDGNDFAWSLLIAFPIGIYLFLTSKSILYRSLYLLCSGFLVYGILGTQSRGAFLALMTIIFYYGISVTNRKALFITVLIIAFFSIITVVPSSYLDRLETIGSYEEDTSAMGRIRAWETAIEMAIDNPILGVGAGNFNSAYGKLYKKPSDPAKWISTHSIYFKVVAEYGFTGIIIIFWLLRTLWKTNKANQKHLHEFHQNNITFTLIPAFLNMSILGFSVAGIFLGGIGYPHIFILSALTLSSNILLHNYLTNNPSQDNSVSIRLNKDN